MSRFTIGGVPDAAVLMVCVIIAVTVSPLATMVANRVKARARCLFTGSVLVVLGTAILIVYYFM